MKILIIVRQISGGGAEASMTKLQRELNLRGLDVQLAAIGSNPSPVTCLGRNSILSCSSNRLLKLGQAIVRLRKLHRQESFQKIILNCELAEFLGAVALSRGTEILVVEHTTRPWIGRRLIGLITRFILAIRGAQWITVVSDCSGIWPYNQPAIHIPNPVVSPKLRDYAVSNHERLELVYVGRLAPSKRPDLVIKVAIELDLPLNVFGDGKLRDWLTQQAKSRKIYFHGFVPNVWDKISPNWIFIFPSLYEGDGIVVIEAVLNGNLVLLSDNEDLRRLDLPDKCYFSDYVDLKKKLATLQRIENDLEFRLTSEDISRIAKERSLAVVADKWLAVLAS